MLILTFFELCKDAAMGGLAVSSEERVRKVYLHFTQETPHDLSHRDPQSPLFWYAGRELLNDVVVPRTRELAIIWALLDTWLDGLHTGLNAPKVLEDRIIGEAIAAT